MNGKGGIAMRIAIVEDSKEDQKTLEELIGQYGERETDEISCEAFSDAVKFIDGYAFDFDVIFMDIEMPYLNGMNAAKKLREIDPYVCLVFVTNLTQFAMQGYSVNAVDYVVKPVLKERLFAVMKKVAGIIDGMPKESLFVKSAGGAVKKVNLSSILYITTEDHLVLFHTTNGTIEEWATMSEIEKKLPDTFVRCNKGILVNLHYVTGVEGNDVLINHERLPVSRLRKKEFLTQLTKYINR